MNKITWKSGTAIVVANMVGTGVFTSLGYQLQDVRSTPAIIILWVLGAVMAICGAFSYAELGTRLPGSGGEYHFLSRIFGPFVGYLSGWISLSIGFAAPVALAAMAMSAYLMKYFPISPDLFAIGIIVLLSAIHSFTLKHSSRFQILTTVLKLVIIVCFIVIGIKIVNPVNAITVPADWGRELLTPGFAVALVYVSYSYAGWNAASYIVEEIKEPVRNLPRALLTGTILVSILYVLLQWIMLRQAPVSAYIGEIEVGQIAAEYMLGPVAAEWVSGAIAFLLISSISAMIWVGPRVSMAMARDHALWSFLKKKNTAGIPVRAVWFQAIISILLILTGTFEMVLLYSGFILQLSSALTVYGIWKLRKEQNNHNRYYLSPLFPALQIIFILFSLWVFVYLLYERPLESLIGLGILSLGVVTYFISNRVIK